jgi:FG-GAP repeat
MRRTVLAVLLLLLAGAVGTAYSPLTQPAQAAAGPSDVGADFNHDGFADLALGVPGENGAGAVNVLYGTAGGLSGTGSQVFFQVGGGGGFFGSALATGDFNHDGFADLAAGAPYRAVGGAGAAGAVSVLYGSAAGLTTSGGRLFTQVAGAVEGNDLFGFALAAGDFNHDGLADLAAGAPGEDVGSIDGSGAVSVLYGSAAGLTTSGGKLFTQVGGVAVEANDLFGFALTTGDFNHDGMADLAAGAPWEAVGSATQAGGISVLYGSAPGPFATGSRFFTQVGGASEANDQFGAQLAAGDFNHNGFADLAAAAPSETIGTIPAAGAVSVLHGSGGGLTTTGGQLFTQDSPGVPGGAESFDRFGGVDNQAG